MKRLIFLILIHSFLPLSANSSDKPNILFILADDVGQEVLQCYGGESYPTPHLDELARTGAKFNHVYSMPVCHPSRIALLTGKYPFRHGQVTWGDFPKKEEVFTFASQLKKAGYATHIAGKWQLNLMKEDVQHPAKLGFDSWDLFGWHEGPRFYEPMIYKNGKVRTDTLGHYGPDLYVRSIVNFMKENREKPFFAFYSMAVAHEVTDDLAKPVPHGPFDRYDNYAEMVAEMDRAVGRLVAALNALKLRENTIIIYTADNGTPPEIIIRGEADGTLVRTPVVSKRNGIDIPGGKKTLLDRGTNVPMIVNWPTKIKPSQVIDDIIDFTDFKPTFIDLAGAKLEKQQGLDGHSFADILRGTGKGKRTWAYCEEAVLPKPGGVEPDGVSSGLRWVRDKQWKLYNNGKLFYIPNDPEEKTPILADKENKEQKEIRIKLKAIIDQL